MSFTKVLLEETEHLVSDIGDLRDYLSEDTELIISRSFPEAESEMRARETVRPGLEYAAPAELEAAVREERRRIIEAGKRAVDKIYEEGEDASLTPDEFLGYEAIVQIYGRPAILIQDGRFFPPPPDWDILETKRNTIEKNIQGVGRIEVPGHPRYGWVGTGFLVADDVVMTNRHVANEFCCLEGQKWVFEAGITPCIDYCEELGGLTPAEYSVRNVIGVHKEVDLALLSVEQTSKRGQRSPEPLTLASDAPDNLVGRDVYVLGYPFWDGRRNDPEVMRSIFNNIYGVKRLQPGKVTRVFPQYSLFNHDCSTLGGNSGSCVVDLETAQVLGLHYAGRYREFNRAVALWELASDPMLTEAGVNFS